MSAEEVTRQFDNKTKDELEAGQYIAYAEKPKTEVETSK